MKEFIFSIFVLAFVPLIAAQCLENAPTSTFITFNPNDMIGQTFFASDTQFLGAALYRLDSAPVSGMFFVIPGSQTIDIGSAIGGAPFFSLDDVIYGNATVPALVKDDPYTFLWVRDPSGFATTLQGASGNTGSSFHDEIWDSEQLYGQWCFSSFAAPSGVPSLVPSSAAPSGFPSLVPSMAFPSGLPTLVPSFAAPSGYPSFVPSMAVPSLNPSLVPSMAAPSGFPSLVPSMSGPSGLPSLVPSFAAPSGFPSLVPSMAAPSGFPSLVPSLAASSAAPVQSVKPSLAPTFAASVSRTPSSSSSSSVARSTFTQVTMRLSKTFEFNETTFKTDMSSLLNINADRINVTSVAGKSVDVNFLLYDAPDSYSADLAKHLQELVDTNDPSLVEYDLETESMSYDTSNAAVPPKESGARLSGSIVAIAVVVPIASVALIGLAVLVIKKTRAHKDSDEAPVEMNSSVAKKKPVDEENASDSDSHSNYL